MNIKIVPSGRIDWCGDCKAEHGYDCPKDKQDIQTVLQEIKKEVEKLNNIPFYIKNEDYINGVKQTVMYVLAIISSRMNK